jgi:hypothetical protein
VTRAGARPAVLFGDKLETASAQAVFENPCDLRNHLHSTAIGTLAKAVQTA